MRFTTADNVEIRGSRKHGFKYNAVIGPHRCTGGEFHTVNVELFIRLGGPSEETGRYRTRLVRVVDDLADGRIRLQFLRGDTWRGCTRRPDEIYASQRAAQAATTTTNPEGSR